MGKTVFDMVNEKTIYLAFLFCIYPSSMVGTHFSSVQDVITLPGLPTNTSDTALRYSRPDTYWCMCTL